MIVPSIDLIGGRTVQLIGGDEQALDAGDPLPWMEKFSLAGDVAVIDLDAARRVGNNRDMIADLCGQFSCRVGGGIRDLSSAEFWLNAGAAKIIIGTAAAPALLEQLPRERVIVALDAVHGEVVVDGWRERTGRTIDDRLSELREYASGFLVTFVEREGRLGGTDIAYAERIVAAAGDARVTIAGGVTTSDEIAALDRIGADAQVGMALYTGRLAFADAIAAPLISERGDGLVPTVVVNEVGAALGLAWSSRASIARAIELRRGVYESRTRGIWIKGERSGATQDLLRIDLDCDRDALRFTVRQHGVGFCHRNTATCWGAADGFAALERTLHVRASTPMNNSYTNRLMSDRALLRSKLREEAGELADANTTRDVAGEAADLFYFAMVRMAATDVTLGDVERVLRQRALRVTRRPGNSKDVGGAA